MKIIKSFGFAFNGMVQAFKDQPNLRVHFFVTLLVIAGGFYFQITTTEWILALVMISVVISLELVNTAIENLTDLVTKDQNPLAGKVKDIAAAAVLFSSIIAAVVGVIIFSKYISLN